MPAPIDIEIRTTGVSLAERELNRLLGGVRNWALNLTSALGAVFSIQQITRFANAAIRAAQENAVAMAQLTAIAGRSTEALAEQAGALQRLTGVADEHVLEIQRMLFTYGANAAQVRRLTPLVLDLAASMGIEARSAARLLGQALDGQSVSLGRLNLNVSSVDELIEKLNARVRGQAEAAFKAQGPVAALRVQMGELAETIGQKLLPAVNAAAAAMNRLLGDGNAWSRQVQEQQARVEEAVARWQAALGRAMGVGSLDWLRQNLAGDLETEKQRLRDLQAELDALDKKLSTTSFSLDFAGHRRDVERHAELQRLIRFQTRLVRDLEAAWRDAGTEAARARAAANLEEAMRPRVTLLGQAYDFLASTIHRARGAVAELNARVSDALGRAAEETAAYERRKQAMVEYRRGVEMINEALEQHREEQARAAAQQAERERSRAFLGTFQGQLGLQAGEMLERLGTAAQNAASIISSTLGRAFASVSEQITALIMGTVAWGEALMNIARSIVGQLVQSIVNFFVTLGARALLNALFGAAITKAAAAAAATAWAGPALLANMATMGGASTVGVSSTFAGLASAPLVSAAALATGGFREGGLVQGPGGPRADAILARLSAGEFVVNAEAVRAYGLPLLEALNNRTARFYSQPPGAGSALDPRAPGTAAAASASPSNPSASLSLILVDSRNQARQFLESAEGEARIVDIVRRHRMRVGIPT